jgi:molybdate transport system substrate-binding protein
MRAARDAVVAGVMGVLVLSGCGGGGPEGDAAGGSLTDETLTVLAAASLTEALTTLGARFEAQHPGSDVVFGFGSSATLAAQITSGAPADVFAAANEATMHIVRDAGATESDPVLFATNTLEIAVPAGNRAAVTRLSDFADERRRIALCAEQVPCGAASRTVFTAAGLTPRPDTWEPDVKAVLQKVASDEVDAGLVYRTEVLAAGDRVEGIAFPESAQAVNRYPIATLRTSDHPALAQEFVDYVLSADGAGVLTEAGFGRA